MTVTNLAVKLPLCDFTELPRLLCACADHNEWAFDYDDLTQVERDYLTSNPTPATLAPRRRYRPLLADKGRKPTEQAQIPDWQGLTIAAGNAQPKSIIVNCHNHTSIGICENCVDMLQGVLADIPELLDDLDVAIAGQTRFVEHGTIGGLAETGSNSGHPVIAAQQRLTRALLGDGTDTHPGVTDWFDARDPAQLARLLTRHLPELTTQPRMPTLARDLTSAVSRARRVIDTPIDIAYYGPCPDCGADLVQERIRKDDTKTPVSCRFPSCGYSQPLDMHQKRILENSLDRHLSVSECVSMITSAGEPVTRDQLNGWIRHQGLPRQWDERPVWRGGEVVMVGMWTLKLRDVLDYARRAEEKKHRKSAV